MYIYESIKLSTRSLLWHAMQPSQILIIAYNIALLSSYLWPVYRSTRFSLWSTMLLYQIFIMPYYIILAGSHLGLLYCFDKSLFLVQYVTLTVFHSGLLCYPTNPSLWPTMQLY